MQAAVSGQLTEQRAEDGNAADLLEEIAIERAHLVKEGKLKKQKTLSPVAEEEKSFELPNNWNWARIGDVVDFINGRAYKKQELQEKGKYAVLRVGNLFTSDKWYYSDLDLPEDKYCKSGDLLYAWSASFGPAIWKGEKAIFHYHIWNVNYHSVNRDFLYYLFKWDVIRVRSSTTGSTMVHVSMENMRPRLFPMPPFAEQERIVAKLDALKKPIAELKELLTQ